MERALKLLARALTGGYFPAALILLAGISAVTAAQLDSGPTRKSGKAVTAPASAKPANPVKPAKPAPPVIVGPCADAVRSIRPGTVDPEPFLSAAACLRKAGSLATPAAAVASQPDTAAAHRDSVLRDSVRAATVPADSALKRLLPDSEKWFVAQLERLRARRDMVRLQGMAWLAALRDPSDPDVWREISESHALAGDPFQAAWALLKQAEKDPGQSGYIQYQIEATMRSLSEPPAPVVLDFLTSRFRHVRPVTAEILESLCWSNRNYGAAYRNTLAWLDLAKPGPGPTLDRASRYHMAGWSDYAAGILERSGWRGYPQPHRLLARALFLRVSYQLEDWPAISAEASKAPKGSLSEEEDHILAAATLRQGRPEEALDRLGRFETGGESSWGYRAQLLRARALLALGRLPEASRVLDALKRSPKRREGTGPILFWQGWLALQQGNTAAAESLLVLASAYTGSQESQRALEYRYWILLDSAGPRTEFFRGLAESPLPPGERIRSLDRVPGNSPLWTHARIEKAQILAAQGRTDSARAVLDEARRMGRDRLAGLRAEAMSAYLQEKGPGGRAAALARYEDLLIEYQQGVVPEFSRGRIRALK